jgi:Amt family ammonium transporter
MLLFMALWMVVVYFPLAHMVWGINGMMNGVWNAKASIHAIDFAGGTVVHMSSGWSALILCLILGKRHGFGKENMAPHSMVLCAIGTGMLWVGWYGFNAGSAVAADGVAANAFMTTTIATAVASFVWPLAEWLVRGKPSVLGFCSGAVAGLVVITPACGFVTAGGALLIGIAAGLIPWFACYKIKSWFGYDDALDTFGVHAIGGTLGALMTGFLARNSANGNLATNLKDYVKDSFGQPLVVEQLKAIVVTLLLAVVGTVIIAYIVKAVVGLRPSEEVEVAGLDLAEHGEEGYHQAR